MLVHVNLELDAVFAEIVADLQVAIPKPEVVEVHDDPIGGRDDPEAGIRVEPQDRQDLRSDPPLARQHGDRHEQRPDEDALDEQARGRVQGHEAGPGEQPYTGTYPDCWFQPVL